jgi:hypothetical protein
VPEALRVAAELGTNPIFCLLRIFAKVYISDHCDTERSFIQRAKIYQELFAVSDG